MSVSNPTQNPLPTEFYTIKILRTFAGSTSGVFLVDVVINLIYPNAPSILTRVIGLIISFIIVGIFRTKSGKLTRDKILLLFFNGLLVFVSASGVNAIYNAMDFSQLASTQKNTSNSGKKTIGIYQSQFSRNKNASLLPILKVKSWWPDKNLLDSINMLQNLDSSDTVVTKADYYRMIHIASNSSFGIDTDSLRNGTSSKPRDKKPPWCIEVYSIDTFKAFETLLNLIHQSDSIHTAYSKNKNYSFKYAKQIREINGKMIVLLDNKRSLFSRSLNPNEIAVLRQHFIDWNTGYDKKYADSSGIQLYDNKSFQVKHDGKLFPKEIGKKIEDAYNIHNKVMVSPVKSSH